LTLPARAAGSSDSHGIDEFFGARHSVNKSKNFLNKLDFINNLLYNINIKEE
jgi:hypothetical protein